MHSADVVRVRAEIDQLYRKESRRIFATLIRLLGDFERAEEALHEAFRAAMEKWPSEGIPQNPASWLVSAGRFKSIDKQRRDARFDHLEDRPDVSDSLSDPTQKPDELPELLEDDRLRLVFTCCHPALAPDAQVALTLREVCDLTTEEIAAAFLTPAPTIAQRIVRAKAKIRDANIPYEVPEREQLAERLDTVLRVVYLVFNEGYSASSGEAATRADLSSEAIRLARLVLELLPEPEVRGLLALMLLHESRRTARHTATGEVILLDDQDRAKWNRELITEGAQLVRDALTSQRFGPYSVQAAIAALARDRAQSQRRARDARWHRGRPRRGRPAAGRWRARELLARACGTRRLPAPARAREGRPLRVSEGHQAHRAGSGAPVPGEADGGAPVVTRSSSASYAQPAISRRALSNPTLSARLLHASAPPVPKETP
jgi:RNA polymerase sigma-70 factor (ECF subfamily)